MFCGLRDFVKVKGAMLIYLDVFPLDFSSKL